MYKRVLLKLSGESLGGSVGKGLDPESLRKYSKEIAQAAKAGLQIAIVNGGGNIFRGLRGLDKGFDRVEGDRMGMLATVINSLAQSVHQGRRREGRGVHHSDGTACTLL